MVDSLALNFLFPTDPGARARRDRVLLVLAIVLAVVLVARAVRKDEGVMARNREFGARFLAGQDPYEDPVRGHRVHGPYPPSYAIVTVPLASVPEPVARAAWAILQVGALAACFVVTRRMAARLAPAIVPHASVVFAVAVLLASRYLLRDMAGGGGNLLYATAALWGIEMALRDRVLAAGVLTALPLVLKPNLAPLVVFLACRGRWRAVASVIAFALVFFAAPALVYGFDAYVGLATRWFVDLGAFARAVNLADPVDVPDGFPLADTTMNQSVRESLWRVLEPETAARAARVITALLVAAAVVAARRARDARAETLTALAFLPVCVLVSPISWKAHHVALLPLFFALTAVAIAERRRWLVVLLVAYYGSCVLLSEELVGKSAKNVLQSWSIVAWGALALFVATLALASRREPASSLPATERR